jgi:hypothetical protein
MLLVMATRMVRALAALLKHIADALRLDKR